MSQDGMTFEALAQVVPPAEPSVAVGGKTYTIKRFGIRKLKDAAAHGYYIWTLFEAVRENAITPVTLLTDGGDSALFLMELATGEPSGTFDEASPEEAIRLLTTIIEVNLDFFVNVLIKEAPAVMQQINKIVEKVKELPKQQDTQT